MATILYRRGEDGELETNKVEAQYVAAELAAGWKLTDETAPGNPEPESEVVSDDEELAQLREQAKEAGIKNAGKMGAERLKEELGLE